MLCADRPLADDRIELRRRPSGGKRGVVSPGFLGELELDGEIMVVCHEEKTHIPGWQQWSTFASNSTTVSLPGRSGLYPVRAIRVVRAGERCLALLRSVEIKLAALATDLRHSRRSLTLIKPGI